MPIAFRCLLFALCALLLVPLAASANETAKIGDETLSVPLPQGFVRYDGLNAAIDQVMQRFVPPSNRSLMVIATPLDAERAKANQPKDLNRFMSVQTARALENQKATLRDFESASAELEKQFVPGGQGAATVQSEANKLTKNANLGVDLKLGETRMLGVYEKTKQSMDMGLIMKAQVANGPVKTVVAAMSLVDVKGKFLFLYVYSDYHGQADADWTRTMAKSWREAIIAANPGEIPTGGFDWNSVLGKAVIGGIIGGMIGLLMKTFKRS
jgi:hypothetical protein